jgi:hypothetical protein
VGLDVHPDSFAAAILSGRDPLKARVTHSVTPLQKWGLSVALRRGTNKAAVAVARKLTVYSPVRRPP